MELEVEKILKEKNIEYRLIKLTQNAYTVEDVVKYSESAVAPDEICKTIIVRGKKTGDKKAILLRGNDKVNFSGIKKLFGEEMTVADPEQVKEATGVEPGAVCPLLLKVPLLVDRKVFDLEKINCGSGDHLYGLEFGTKDLTKCVEFKIEDLSKISS